MTKETNRKLLRVGFGAAIVAGGILLVGKTISPKQREDVGEISGKTSRTSRILTSPTKENVSKEVSVQIKHLKEVVKNNPEESSSALRLAKLLQDGHDPKGAAVYYAIGLKGTPSNDAARIDYSLCLSLVGKTDEAMRQSRIVYGNNPKNVQACYNIGSLYANRGVKDSAITYWSKVMEFEPKSELAKKAKKHIITITSPAGAQ